mmetsp:Transcript_59128/g.168130  ORF Transcript_59128/g.168130 Transcript_59128/m.168130 type:complete len:202 (+) Transcript_59128:609-1214(+)
MKAALSDIGLVVWEVCLHLQQRLLDLLKQFYSFFPGCFFAQPFVFVGAAERNRAVHLCHHAQEAQRPLQELRDRGAPGATHVQRDQPRRELRAVAAAALAPGQVPARLPRGLSPRLAQDELQAVVDASSQVKRDQALLPLLFPLRDIVPNKEPQSLPRLLHGMGARDLCCRCMIKKWMAVVIGAAAVDSSPVKEAHLLRHG